MIKPIKRYLDARGAGQLVALCLLLLLAAGAVDFLSGFELAFSIFYLAPIVIIAWYLSRTMAYLFCGIAGLIWLSADISSGHLYSQFFVPVWNSAVRIGYFLLVAYLVVEIKAHLKQEKTLAMTDSLTGILNVRAFKEVSRNLLNLSARYQHPVALGFIDLDDFKRVNDSAGHAEGDRVLVAVAQALAHCLRNTDVVARIGGDEFAILLPQTDQTGARKLFTRIRDNVMQECTERNWPIGLSVGVALYETAPANIDAALDVADKLMYRVKNAGKHNILYETIESPTKMTEVHATRQPQTF